MEKNYFFYEKKCVLAAFCAKKQIFFVILCAKNVAMALSSLLIIYYQ